MEGWGEAMGAAGRGCDDCNWVKRLSFTSRKIGGGLEGV